MKKKLIRFPKKELNVWLKKHKSWNHQQWLDLLSELSKAGFAEWTQDFKRRDSLGLYLETNRKIM